ncbi:MAG TPA: PEP-CTERM sorting domain-containing protein, partial [Gammaproteobacteria bacterium]
TAINPANASYIDEGSPFLLDVGPPGAGRGTPGGVHYSDSPIFDMGPITIFGFHGAQLTLKTPSIVTFSLLGFEAGYGNQFLVNDTVIFDTETPGFNEVSQAGLGGEYLHSMYLPAGLIPFEFRVTTTGESLANGSNPDNSTGGDINSPAIFMSIFNMQMISGNSIFLGFDDGGAGPDYDYDDMFLSLGAVEVPEPGGLSLLSLGLIGLVTLRKRMIK